MMKQALMHFGSAIVGLGLAYLVNQLPNVPDNLKPWVPLGMVPLVVLTVWFAVTQGETAKRRKTKISGNELGGDRAEIRATDAEVTDNKLTGADTKINTNDGTAGSGRNP
jgi:hypothetical protein